VQVDRKEPLPLPPEKFFDFRAKNAGFCAFYYKITTCGHKPGLGGGLIDPVLGEDVKSFKCTGVEHLAGGLNFPNPINSHRVLNHEEQKGNVGAYAEAV